MQRGQRDVQSWPQDLDQDQLAAANDVDFTKFLELGTDFSQFESIEQQNVHSGLDTPMERLTFGQNGQVLSPQQHALLQDMAMSMGTMPSHMDFQHLQQLQSQADQYQQYPMYQQMQNPYQHQVPPTPVSAEMHATKYVQSIDAAGQIIFERQNASFTPLVSPAQTPLDHAWSMPDYVVGEEFFSPLTSPAIEAQHHMTATHATSSPVDLNLESGSASSKRPRRKLNPTSRVASVRNLKAPAPSKTTTRRRQNSLSNGSLDSPLSSIPKHKHLLPDMRHAMSAGSEDSVSPEPYLESTMRPPPVPQSRTPSTLRPQSRTQNAPATPATLMRIPGNQLDNISGDQSVTHSPEIMEDISLPAAAADLPPRILPELNINVGHDDEDSTPTLSAKTPKLSADSTPRSAGVKFSNNSQELLPKPARGGRSSKKRQSVSQVTVSLSPALRPKISPSISPMVPSTASGIPIMSAETSALYLASKSNYQNIIDGTHLPGVSYPETLAENLSSKRTSHKIAEQGRRNRINLALKEIESLLPASITAAASKREKDDAAESGEKPSSGQGASKASTVEMAIVYIQSLQQELQVTKEKLEAAETKLREGSSSGSQTSDQT